MKTEFRYGRKIRQQREARAWTQEHLAALAGVETRTIQRAERDQTKSPETLNAIGAAFNLDV
jgi:transcriptional regulator with XRE-family HTH domain